MSPNPMPNLPAEPMLAAGWVVALILSIVVVAALLAGFAIARRSAPAVARHREIVLDREIVLPDVIEHRRARRARARHV